MGDPRNWTARKAHGVREANAAADRDRLRAVSFYNHSAADLRGQRGPHFLSMHPCDTFRVFRLSVIATCMGCVGTWPIERWLFDDSAVAHRPWPVVMGELVCPRCLSCPHELRFKDQHGEVGAISTAAEITLHVSTSTTQVSRPVRSRGYPDPEVQHDDGGEA